LRTPHCERLAYEIAWIIVLELSRTALTAAPTLEIIVELEIHTIRSAKFFGWPGKSLILDVRAGEYAWTWD
jgi:hypothetical protein